MLLLLRSQIVSNPFVQPAYGLVCKLAMMLTTQTPGVWPVGAEQPRSHGIKSASTFSNQVSVVASLSWSPARISETRLEFVLVFDFHSWRLQFSGKQFVADAAGKCS